MKVNILVTKHPYNEYFGDQDLTTILSRQHILVTAFEPKILARYVLNYLLKDISWLSLHINLVIHRRFAPGINDNQIRRVYRQMNAKHPFRKILESRMPEEYKKRIVVSAPIKVPDFDDLSYEEEPTLEQTNPEALTLEDKDWIDI